MINDCNKYSFTLIILEYYLFIFFEKCIFRYVKYNFMEFVLPPVAWWFQHFYAENIKNEQCVYLSQWVAFQLPMLDFLYFVLQQ